MNAETIDIIAGDGKGVSIGSSYEKNGYSSLTIKGTNFKYTGNGYGGITTAHGSFIAGEENKWLNDFTITGGNFIATEEASEYQYNGNGCNSTGDALIIEACNYPGGTPSVVISGGNFTSAHNKGIAYYQYSKTVNDEEVVYAGEVIVYDSVDSTTTDNITKVSATLGQ